jgi:hypothetical protein
MQQQNSNTRESKDFVMHENFIRMSAKLNDEQLVRFIRHIYQYINSGEPHVEEADLIVSIIFDEWRIVYESDKEKYRQTVMMRSEAGKKGMKRRWGNREAAKQPDTEGNDDCGNETSGKDTDGSCDSNKPCDNNGHGALKNEDSTTDAAAQGDDNAKLTDRGGKRKKTSATAQTIDERKQAFFMTMQTYADSYDREMLNDFYQYWTELDKRQRYMRFELQKTWETGKRLSLWARKSFK